MPNLHVVELNSTEATPKIIIALLNGAPHTFSVSAVEYSLLSTVLRSIFRTDKESSTPEMQARRKILANLIDSLKESASDLPPEKSLERTEPTNTAAHEFRRAANIK